MKKRKAKVKRQTKETDVSVDLAIDGKGDSIISTSIPFLDHMLTLFSKHALFDLVINAKGDVDVDIHHTNEDIGIVLGQALKKALGAKKGIKRFGESFVPMDGCLVRVVIDISSRGSLYIHYKAKRNLENELSKMSIAGISYSFVACEQFVKAFATNAGITLHIEILAFDKDLHHLLEAIFKAMGRALDEATQVDRRQRSIPSTKGVL